MHFCLMELFCLAYSWISFISGTLVLQSYKDYALLYTWADLWMSQGMAQDSCILPSSARNPAEGKPKNPGETFLKALYSTITEVLHWEMCTQEGSVALVPAACSVASGRLPQVGSKGKNQSGLESSLVSMNTAKTALCSEWEQELHLCKRVKDMDEVLFLRRSFLSQSQYWKKQARMFDTNSGGNFFLCIFR